MKDIVSKFSLYDILAIIVPGGTMLLYISLSLLGATLVFDSTVSSNGIAWIIILITSYLLGLLNMCFTNYLFSSFRNNSGMLAESFKRALHKEPQLNMLNKYGKIVDEALNSPNNIIEIVSVILKYLAYLAVIFIDNKLIYNSCRPLSAGILILICVIIIPAVFVFSNNSHGKDV